MFIFIAAFVLRLVDKNGEWTVSLILLGSDLLIFSFFLYRLQTGYFDYVRKVRNYVMDKAGAQSGASAPAAVAA